MAGIGFELKKILDRQSFLSDLTAYMYAAMVSSGPWLMSILSLAVLGVYHNSQPRHIHHELFQATVVYTYAFSLILVGVVQVVATRFMADRLYEKKTDQILSTLYTCIVMVLVAGTLITIPPYWICKVSLVYKIMGVMLFLVICMIWLCMIVLSAIKDYNGIVHAFVAGAVISIAGALYLHKPMGTEGYLAGYLLGQWVTLFWFLAKICVEFPSHMRWNPNFIRSMRQFWELVGIGFLFNFGIWADKFMFWLAPDARMILNPFRTNDIYEGPVYFAYLTIVPATAIFLLKVETTFYLHYRQYYAKVVRKGPLHAILEEKAGMVQALKSSIREIFIIQGTVTVLCIILAPKMMSLLFFSTLQIPVFRIVLIGSFLQILLCINVILLFYFDLRKEVLLVSFIFAAGNVLLNVLTIKMGLSFYGYGYTYACLIALMTAFFQLNKNLNNLEFLTFAKQPVAS